MDLVHDSVIETDLDGIVLRWNRAAERIYGWRAAEAVGRNIRFLSFPEDFGRLHDLVYAPLLDQGQHEVLLRNRHRDGREIFVAARLSLLRDEHGSPVGVLRCSNDVTERVRASESVVRSEERFRAIVETTAEWIWEIDTAGRHTFTNPAVEHILGYAADEFLELDTFDLMHPDDRRWVAEGLQAAREARRGWSGWVIRWRHRDGSYRDLESNARPILDARGELVGFRGADRDITERRQMQERLLQAEKMEAVGKLAGGIAHDFNNLLVAVLCESEMLLDQVAPEHRERVEEIHKAGERAAALTNQLLAFSRKQVLRPRVIDLNAVVADLRKLLERLLEENTALLLALSADPVVVKADPAQVERVVMNLITNARDAMRGRSGEITLGTELVDVDAARAEVLGLPAPGKCALLTVADTGEGMDPATAARVFEPFFTTKKAGHGTGLGLATVYGIVKQSGGAVQVESRADEGTRVAVYLPHSAERIEAAEPAPQVRGGSERVLVVEDEVMVASTLERALRRAGFEVVVAHDGAQALDLDLREQRPFDLLITDVVMPGMTGFELARALRERHAALPVLFISGYSAEAIGELEEAGRADVRSGFLSKPFTSAELVSRVRALLDLGDASRTAQRRV